MISKDDELQTQIKGKEKSVEDFKKKIDLLTEEKETILKETIEYNSSLTSVKQLLKAKLW